MEVVAFDRLKQIRDMQIAKLEEMQKNGESRQKIDKMKLAIKCTDRRLERMAAAEYDESIANIQPLGGE